MEIEISQLVRTARRLWFVPVILAIVLGLLGFGASRLQDSTYSASAELLVVPQVAGESILADSEATETYITLVTSGPVLDRVIIDLELDLPREELAAMVQATKLPGTQIIQITVSADDPQLAADIANSLSRNMVTAATDLSIGRLQTRLDELTLQSNTVRDRIVVIDSRLEVIGTDENADDAEVQAEVAQLKRTRLAESQSLADLDSSIRDVNSSLNKMSIPVIVTDTATPPELSNLVSPLLIATLGAFLGGLIGFAWIMFKALTDRTLRTADQVNTTPVIANLDSQRISNDDSSSCQMLAARASLTTVDPQSKKLVMVSARENEARGDIVSVMLDQLVPLYARVEFANGVLDDPAAMHAAAGADVALVVAAIGRTLTKDIEEMRSVLKSTRTEVLGTVVLEY